MNQLALVKAIKEQYPDIDWLKFEDADKALNWELWNGPLPSNYWSYVEPLEHYVWQGFEQACKDITEMLDSLPWELWYDDDSGQVTTKNPEDDEYNYYQLNSNGDAIDKDDPEWDPDKDSEWGGGESWHLINVRKELMFKETYQQIF